MSSNNFLNKEFAQHGFNANKLENSLNLHEIIKIVEDYIKMIYNEIRKNNERLKSELVLELPYIFDTLVHLYQDGDFSLQDIQKVIWGKIIKRLLDDKFTCKIKIIHNEEKAILFINWNSNIEKFKELSNFYGDIINQCKI